VLTLKKQVLSLSLFLDVRGGEIVNEELQMNEQYTDDQKPNKDLGTQGEEDTLKGKLNQAGGKIQSKAGEVLGNKDMQAKGDAKQVGGKVQSTFGQGEKKVDDALNPDKVDDTTKY
jgi:uncharacterized protein YjbJ (UPF0337 family)